MVETCPRCGALLEGNENFCNMCGSECNKQPPQQPPQQPLQYSNYVPPQPNTQPYQQYPPGQPHYQPPGTTPKKKQRVSPLVIILISLVALGAIVTGIVLITLRGNTTEQSLIKNGKGEVPQYVDGSQDSSNGIEKGKNPRVTEDDTSLATERPIPDKKKSSAIGEDPLIIAENQIPDNKKLPTAQDDPLLITEIPVPDKESPQQEDNLLSLYKSMISGNEFFISVFVQRDSEIDDGGIIALLNAGVVMDIAKKGIREAMIIESADIHMITEGWQVYTINHKSKMVGRMPSTNAINPKDMLPEVFGYAFTAAGSDKLFDRSLPYEAYYTIFDPDKEMRLFADGTRLAGIQILINDELITSMEIIEFDENAPPDMFEIPEDYRSFG